MARYVLVEFDSTEAADQFVNKTMDRTEQGAHYRVVGYFFRPTKFCECGPLSESQVKTQVYTDKKFGVRAHRRCRRPRREVGLAPRNLLDPIDAPVTQRSAFLTLTGNYAGKGREGTPLPNHPITVAHDAGRDPAKQVRPHTMGKQKGKR
jgi:hypothetical protein